MKSISLRVWWQYFIHHMRMHSVEKPHECGQCDYKAAQAQYLTNHMRTHSGERPYKCDQCDYAASQSITLKVHMRGRHKETFEFDQLLKCKGCNLSFKIKSELTDHICENLIFCSECPKTYSSPDSLKKHVKREHSKNSVKCDRCGEELFNLKNLKEHSKIHRQSDLKCSMCQKLFATLTN